MPADHKVDLIRQVFATLVPIINLWAFYQIRKLRKYLLYVFIPSIILATVFIGYIEYINRADDMVSIGHKSDRTLAYAITSVFGVGLQGMAIYLVVKWSQQHNCKYDAPTPQTS